MRPTTNIAFRFQSVGHPDDTLEGFTHVAEAVKHLAQWMLRVKMGSRIDVRFARTIDGLDVGKPADQELIDELDGLMSEEVEAES